MKYDRETLVKKIAEHEGIVLEPYNDSLGISTIGIGRNLEGRGIDDYELMHMNKTLEEIVANGLTEEEAYYLCNNDIDIVEKELLKQKPIVEELNETVRARGTRGILKDTCVQPRSGYELFPP